jgi:sulfur relay (sulfurtransferase) DsrC/TusE family protein
MRTTNGESVQLDSDGYLCRLEDWHEDIAIGLTRERVRQIQVEGLKALRKIMEGHGFSVDLIKD